MASDEFWTNLRREFSQLNDKYPTVGVYWHAPSATWTLADLEGTGRELKSLFYPGIPGPDLGRTSLQPEDIIRCGIEFSAATRIAMKTLGFGDALQPWAAWASYVKSHADMREVFTVTGRTPCTEKEWDLGVRDSKPLDEVRRLQRYTTGDEFKHVYARTRSGNLRKLSPLELEGKTSGDLRRYYHWLESGKIRAIFENSAVLCADLASRAAQGIASTVAADTLPAEARKVNDAQSKAIGLRKPKPKPQILPAMGSVNKQTAANALGRTVRTVERMLVNRSLTRAASNKGVRVPVEEIRSILDARGVRQRPKK